MEKMNKNVKLIIDKKIDNLIQSLHQSPMEVLETIDKKGNICLNASIVKFKKESYIITAFSLHKM